MRLVLADDHRLVLEALALLLGREEDLEVVATCVDGLEALAAVRRHHPDILVLDLRMPKVDGLGVLRELASAGEATQVVVLTAGRAHPLILRALKLARHRRARSDARAGICGRRRGVGGRRRVSGRGRNLLLRLNFMDNRSNLFFRNMMRRETRSAKISACV